MCGPGESRGVWDSGMTSVLVAAFKILPLTFFIGLAAVIRLLRVAWLDRPLAHCADEIFLKGPQACTKPFLEPECLR